MQHLTHNLLQIPKLVDEPNRLFESNYLGSYGSNGSMTSEDRGYFNDELQAYVFDNDVLPFLWNNVSFFQHLLL
jgi:hypothetical protein